MKNEKRPSARSILGKRQCMLRGKHRQNGHNSKNGNFKPDGKRRLQQDWLVPHRERRHAALRAKV